MPAAIISLRGVGPLPSLAAMPAGAPSQGSQFPLDDPARQLTKVQNPFGGHRSQRPAERLPRIPAAALVVLAAGGVHNHQGPEWRPSARRGEKPVRFCVCFPLFPTNDVTLERRRLRWKRFIDKGRESPPWAGGSATSS